MAVGQRQRLYSGVRMFTGMAVGQRQHANANANTNINTGINTLLLSYQIQ
jgi:hypothetical protein